MPSPTIHLQPINVLISNDPVRIFYWRFFVQQFKRSCLPDGPKVGSVTLSPRGDWRMPSDAAAALWLAELEQIPLNDNIG